MSNFTTSFYSYLPTQHNFRYVFFNSLKQDFPFHVEFEYDIDISGRENGLYVKIYY